MEHVSSFVLLRNRLSSILERLTMRQDQRQPYDPNPMGFFQKRPASVPPHDAIEPADWYLSELQAEVAATPEGRAILLGLIEQHEAQGRIVVQRDGRDDPAEWRFFYRPGWRQPPA